MKRYPPGHFLELVRLHNWPPMFAPQVNYAEIASQHARAEHGRFAALINRQVDPLVLPVNGTAAHIVRPPRHLQRSNGSK